ncbi:hypothetical protein E1287_01310 [Actinomadura sp. KC06]|uniref:hypothetical protein n=1 Tax=Actinomadura sp. KC06 TaxID=2530369 RepID=UPI00104462A6|nr:hypothetical protein [Actinomadura sp. KC06]TDD40185.1 hypothetical protein E1287_01310 [Actinomadura sp. KC06]
MKTLDRAELITVTGLVTGAAGLLIQKVAGVEMPVVPPGMIILLVVAALMAATRWRWTPVLAVLAALAEVAGFVGSLADADAFGEFAGASVRGAGITVALVAGIAAAIGNYRSRKSAAPAPTR